MFKSFYKRRRKEGISATDLTTIVALWLVGLVTVFILIGANARGILWIFLLGAYMSYYTLTRK